MFLKEDWTQYFPGLSKLETSVKDILLEQSRPVKLAKGTRIFGAGKIPENLLFLRRGTVRVQQNAENGRDIVLYRVTAGESCVMTTACMLTYEEQLAEGIAESDLEAIAIPTSCFETLISTSTVFRHFVFRAYNARMNELLMKIQDVAFSRIDERLAQKLCSLTQKSDELNITHQELATELGSVREVISRQLKTFQKQGWITTMRGKIMITDRDALRSLAGS